MKVFSNIPLLPYEELLQANIGLSTHRGGALFPDWESEVESRHCRGNRQPVDALPSERQCLERWDFSGIWAGPFCGHFGHQIAEFSMRLPEALIDRPETPVIFGLRYGSLVDDIAKSPEYFRSILTWFGIAPGRVRLVNQPTMIAELSVYPQAEMLNGAGPSRAHLDRLTDLTQRNLGVAKKTGTLYVSRSRFSSGRMAGELYLEQYLRDHGVEVIFPELVPLDEQLRRYATARHVIFAEGSALHALQLLGGVLGEISVLMRRPGATMFRSFTEPRSEHYREVDLVRGILCSYNVFGTPLDALGLSLLDEQRLLSWLKTLGISSAGWSSSGFLAEVEKDIRTWLAKEADRRPLHHRTKGSILNVLHSAGLKDIGNEVTRNFPEMHEIPPGAVVAYREALAYESKGAIESAISAIEAAISEDGRVAEFHKQKSVWLDRLGRGREAWLSASVALDLSAPDDVRVLAHCAGLASKSGEGELGLLMIEKAIELDPENGGLHGQRSVFLDRLGRMSEALDAAKSAIGLQPENPHALAHYSNVLAKAGLIQDALVSIDQAIRMAPGQANFHSQRSVWLGRLGRKEEALGAAQQAVVLAPRNASFRIHLSNVLTGLGQLDSALIEVDQAISLDGEAAAFHRQKAQLLERQGRFDEALVASLRACSLAPLDASLKAQAAGFASRVGNGEFAVSLVDEAIGLAPDNGGFYGLRSVFLDRMGRSDEAKDAALYAINLQPNNPHARAHLSNVLARMGDLQGALDAVDDAIRISPEIPSFHSQRSVWLGRKGDRDGALRAALRAVELAPKDSGLRAHLSNVFSGQGKFDLALVEIDVAISLNKDSEALINQRASILKRLG